MHSFSPSLCFTATLPVPRICSRASPSPTQSLTAAAYNEELQKGLQVGAGVWSHGA